MAEFDEFLGNAFQKGVPEGYGATRDIEPSEPFAREILEARDREPLTHL